MPDGTSCLTAQETSTFQNDQQFCNSLGSHLPVILSKQNATIVFNESMASLVSYLQLMSLNFRF
jgi:hypothetical protein